MHFALPTCLGLFAGAAVAAALPTQAHSALSGHIVSARSAALGPLGITIESIEGLNTNQLTMLARDLRTAYSQDDALPRSYWGSGTSQRESPLWDEERQATFYELLGTFEDAEFELTTIHPRLSRNTAETIHKLMEEYREIIYGLDGEKTPGVIALEAFFEKLALENYPQNIVPTPDGRLYTPNGTPQKNKRSAPSAELGLTVESIKGMNYNQLLMVFKDILAAYWVDDFPPSSFPRDTNQRKSPLWVGLAEDKYYQMMAAFSSAGSQLESSNPHISREMAEDIYKSMVEYRDTINGLEGTRSPGVIAMENFFKYLSLENYPQDISSDIEGRLYVTRKGAPLTPEGGK